MSLSTTNCSSQFLPCCSPIFFLPRETYDPFVLPLAASTLILCCNKHTDCYLVASTFSELVASLLTNLVANDQD
jgi:hypothetical protein